MDTHQCCDPLTRLSKNKLYWVVCWLVAQRLQDARSINWSAGPLATYLWSGFGKCRKCVFMTALPWAHTKRWLLSVAVLCIQATVTIQLKFLHCHHIGIHHHLSKNIQKCHATDRHVHGITGLVQCCSPWWFGEVQGKTIDLGYPSQSIAVAAFPIAVYRVNGKPLGWNGFQPCHPPTVPRAHHEVDGRDQGHHSLTGILC